MTSSVAPRAAPSAISSKRSRDSGVVWTRGAHFAGDVIFDGADENGFAGGGVEQRFGQKGGGGFAVGAGDAGGGELALGMAEEGGGGLRQRAAAMLDFEDGQAGRRRRADGRRWARSR